MIWSARDLGFIMDLPEESVDCMRPWKACLPGLPSHKLSVVYPVCFPDSDLVLKRHRAEPDVLTCLALNRLIVRCAEQKYVDTPTSRPAAIFI